MTRKKRILLVEDEPALLNLYSELLKDEGYSVVEASDGESALNILKKESELDLLLLDEIIPKLRGTEIISILKKDKKINRPQKLILMTNLDKESIEKKLRELNCSKVKYAIKSSMTPIDFIDMVKENLAS